MLHGNFESLIPLQRAKYGMMNKATEIRNLLTKPVKCTRGVVYALNLKGFGSLLVLTFVSLAVWYLASEHEVQQHLELKLVGFFLCCFVACPPFFEAIWTTVVYIWRFQALETVPASSAQAIGVPYAEKETEDPQIGFEDVRKEYFVTGLCAFILHPGCLVLLALFTPCRDHRQKWFQLFLYLFSPLTFTCTL